MNKSQNFKKPIKLRNVFVYFNEKMFQIKECKVNIIVQFKGIYNSFALFEKITFSKIDHSHIEEISMESFQLENGPFKKPNEMQFGVKMGQTLKILDL